MGALSLSAPLALVFLAALLAPWLQRRAGRRTALLLAAIPLLAGLLLLSRAGFDGRGPAIVEALPWVPGLGVTFALRLDALALLFALLVCGVGAPVVQYAGDYLADHPRLGRFQGTLLLFSGAMLGLILADDLLLLYVFWELTSLASYLLIGFESEDPHARDAALQAWLVTGAGGLAMLAGFLVLGQEGGTLRVSDLLASSALRAEGIPHPALALIALGAFTKSAQVPFHFWLPSAMAAPTPVSAYLHSATMVVAGVYLLARLSPIGAGHPAWNLTLCAVGAATAVVGGVQALVQRDLKRILACSTIGTLGLLVLLLGTGGGEAAVAVVAYLAAHALYKAALFLVVGAVDRAAGTREVDHLGGLARSMPITAAAALLAAASMIGLPPLLGFIGKERILETALHRPASTFLMGVVVASAALTVAAALLAGFRPFLVHARTHKSALREPPPRLWPAPLILAIGGLATGAVYPALERGLLLPAAGAIAGRPPPLSPGWPAPGPGLAWSALAVAAGVALYLAHGALRRAAERAQGWVRLGPTRWYAASLSAVRSVAAAQTRLLQSGYLHRYLVVTLAVVAASGAIAIAIGTPGALPRSEPLHLQEGAIGLVVLAGAVAAPLVRSRLGAIAVLGIVGYGVALLFTLLAGPDVAMTQFLVETLMVVLFVLVLHRMPDEQPRRTAASRARDAGLALAIGAIVAALLAGATRSGVASRLARYYAAQSLPRGHGRNIVNVILVDFRSLDTLGEIAVLAIAGMGVRALLRPTRDRD